MKVMFYTDLVLDNGELVMIECPDKFFDDFFKEIERCMKLRDWLCTDQWDGCSVEYMGTNLSRINMGKVVGLL